MSVVRSFIHFLHTNMQYILESEHIFMHGSDIYVYKKENVLVKNEANSWNLYDMLSKKQSSTKMMERAQLAHKQSINIHAYIRIRMFSSNVNMFTCSQCKNNNKKGYTRETHIHREDKKILHNLRDQSVNSNTNNIVIVRMHPHSRRRQKITFHVWHETSFSFQFY